MADDIRPLNQWTMFYYVFEIMKVLEGIKIRKSDKSLDVLRLTEI